MRTRRYRLNFELNPSPFIWTNQVWRRWQQHTSLRLYVNCRNVGCCFLLPNEISTDENSHEWRFICTIIVQENLPFFAVSLSSFVFLSLVLTLFDISANAPKWETKWLKRHLLLWGQLNRELLVRRRVHAILMKTYTNMSILGWKKKLIQDGCFASYHTQSL